MNKTWKRSVALLAMLTLLLGCFPVWSFANVTTTETDVQARVVLSQVSGDHYIVELQAKTNEGVKLAGGITWMMGYDNTVFELLDNTGKSIEGTLEEDVANIGNYVLYDTSEKHFSGISAIDGVIGAKAGTKSYISIYTTNVKGNLTAEDTAEFTTVLSYELQKKSGAALKSDSLFYPAHTELLAWSQAYQIYFSDGKGETYIQGDANGTGGDDTINCPILGLPAEYELSKTAPEGDTLTWADTLKTTGYQTGTVTVENTGSKALTNVTAAVTGEKFTVSPESQATLNAGESISFSLMPKNDAGVGTHTGILNVEATGTEKVTIDPVNLSFTVTEWGFAPKESYTTTYGAVTSIDLSEALTGGTAPYKYSLAGGTLPTGLSLSAAGKIEGTPTEATAAEGKKITVKVTDSSSPAKEATAETTVIVKAKAPDLTDFTLKPGNKKIDASWTANANGAEPTYRLVLSAKTTTQSAMVTTYEYLDGAGAAQSVQVREGAENPTFTSGGSLWITIGAVSFPVTASKSAIEVVTPAGIAKIKEEITKETSFGFTGLENSTLYTVTLTAENSAGTSAPISREATPKGSSGGGGGGGGSSSGSGGSTTTTGTEVKKDLASNGEASIGAGDVKNAKSIEVKNSQIIVSLNQQAVNALDKTTGLVIKTEKKNGTTLNETAKELLGSRPVFDVTATQNGKAVTDFGSGRIVISIAYTPASGEDTGRLGLYYINDQGGAEKVSGSKYDATLKAVTGQTSHLSFYGVGYDKNAADTSTGTPGTSKGLFRDISSSDWFYTAVMNLAGREILSGVPDEDAKGNPVGTYTFRPQTNVTRAEFVTMLARAAGADLSQYSTKVFNDVNTDDWYAGAAAWASSAGVASGTGEGSFSPNANITRQDMAVMVNRYVASVAKTTLTAKNAKIAFTDAAQIEGYAAGAVETMQTAGILSGAPNEDVNGNPIGTYQFKPFANATRAEAASMLSGLLTALK